MDKDKLRVLMYLRKKKMGHAEAEDVARKFRCNQNGTAKGKAKKQNRTVVAYHCPYSEDHWHIGHSNFKGGYDPAYEFRKLGI